MITASAPAKAILLGEHTALYCGPALIMALDLRAYVTVSARGDDEVRITAEDLGLEDAPLKRNRRGTALVEKAVELVGGGGFDITIESYIPLASGLGSSASIAAALLRALKEEKGQPSHMRELAREALECENMVHTKSSGVDPFAVVFGGLSLYRKGSIEKLRVKEYPRIVVAHSGITSDTGDIVEDVDRIRGEEPKRFKKFLETSEKTVLEGRRAVAERDWASLGRLMDNNHALLAGMGVSSARMDGLAEAARGAGAFGAKLSGAGRGGIITALVDENTEKAVSEALSSMGGKIIQANISEEGIRKE